MLRNEANVLLKDSHVSRGWLELHRISEDVVVGERRRDGTVACSRREGFRRHDDDGQRQVRRLIAGICRCILLHTMFSFCRHVTTAPLKLQRYLSSTKNILNSKDAIVDRHKRYDLKPFRMELESVYEEDHYPSLERREIVAQDLGVPINSISRWLNRRYVVERALLTSRLFTSRLQSYRGQNHAQSSRTRHKRIPRSRFLYKRANGDTMGPMRSQPVPQ